MKTILKSTSLIIIFSISFSAFSQDLINKRNGESVEAKIESIEQTIIKYKNFNNLNGPIYIIDKNDVESIKFENNTIEEFEIINTSTTRSKSEVQALIVESINAHGFEEDTFKRKYRASFDGDYLRLIVLNKHGEPCNGGLVYDFSNVYNFQRVSNRSDQLAFINIFVSVAQNKSNTRWDRHKLIMRVDSPKNAELIVKYLKEYNSILKM